MAQFRTDQHKLDFSNNKTRYEVMMLDDRLTPSGTWTDAFGRLRVTEPFTLFDSNHRFSDNGLWATSNTAGATYAFQSNEGCVNLNVNSTAEEEVVRETFKVFSYQPGKSLLVMNSFVMATPKTNLRQRVGYFGAKNGVFLENDGVTNYLVLRSFVTGSVVETKIPQSQWNRDKFDGTGLSTQRGSAEHSGGLDVTKSNILWFDIEWLGVGDVRCGFVVDGRYCVAHVFHNDNVNTTTYMTTASLPCRYEIKNTGTTSGSSTLKQICTSITSEGGYALLGTQQAVSIPVSTPVHLTTANTLCNLISLRLKSSPDRLDAIVIMTAVSILAVTNNAFYNWQIRVSATTTGGTWVDAGNNTAVEYKLGGATVSGGRVLASGFTTSTTQSSVPVDVLKEALFKFQLERNGLTSTPLELTLCAVSNVNGSDMYAAVDWEEVTR